MIPIKMPAGTTDVVSLRAPDPIHEIAPFAIVNIKVSPNPLRPLDAEEVKCLAVSMKRIGLMTPITVRYYAEKLGPDSADDGYEIIAGRHRYAAAVSLGWDEIDAIVIECSDVDAKLWEIAENLHRAELTQLERSEQVAEWIRLTDSDALQIATHKKKGQQPGGVNAASRELGIEQTDAHRAVKVDSLSDEAKAAAREHGLDNNRSAMLAAAGESEPQDQVAKIVQLAVQKTKPKPIEATKEDEEDGQEATDFFVEADVPGAAATNKLIKKVVDFWENIDPSFTAWTENDPEQEATEALLGAVYAFAGDLRRRAYQPIYKKRRADNKISRAYSKRFGFIGGVRDDERVRLMVLSLQTGVDQLADVKREHKEAAEQYDRKQEEFQRTPITSEAEQHYTAMIKHRGLYEGACRLAWPMYFKYRDEHPDLPPLSPDDLEYAGMWTSCAVRP